MADRNKSVVDEGDVKVTTVFSDLHEHAIIDEDATLDDKALAALGYKQEFKRSRSFRQRLWQSF
jgi:hypothetical protein